MAGTLLRSIQRHILPGFVSTIYYGTKYRCLISPASKVQLNRNISFGKGTVVKPFAVIQLSGTGKISIGNKCSINNFVQMSTGDADIHMGDFVRIGPHVTILASSRNYKNKRTLILEQGFSHESTIIENDVLIASGAIILKGVHIGIGAVIGAGSVVTKNVPSYTVVAGTPAKKISERN